MPKLGNIVAAATTAVNNTNTAVPFLIPLSVRQINIRTTGADLSYEIKTDAVNPSAVVTSAAAGYPLAANIALNGIDVGPYGPGCIIVICVYNAGAGSETLEVWSERSS